MTIVVDKWGVEISQLKATLQQLSVDGPSVIDALHAENNDPDERVKGLNVGL